MNIYVAVYHLVAAKFDRLMNSFAFNQTLTIDTQFSEMDFVFPLNNALFSPTGSILNENMKILNEIIQFVTSITLPVHNFYA